MNFLHELPDTEELFRVVAAERNIDPYLVEKDYWIMHALWGLKQQNYDYELKGGTSLSKGYGIIERFSEDIDIKIIPKDGRIIPAGKNHDKPQHIEKRKCYFDQLAQEIIIPGLHATRDTGFDDPKLRNAGIRLNYHSLFETLAGVKQGVLLEVGFDTTTPNEPIDVSSWAFNKAKSLIPNLTNTIAQSVKCYLPEYTFVEKLQTITRKVRQQSKTGEFGTNFLRHFYDIHQLFQLERIKSFMTTADYIKHKNARFRGEDNPDLKNNLAFNLDAMPSLLEKYCTEFEKISNLFMGAYPNFKTIYTSIIAIRHIG